MTAAAVMSRAASVSGGEVLLEARQVRKHFPIHAGLFGTTTATIKAVDGIDFVIRKGETFGLVGESGCGKSTTARLLLRLEAPTSGEILFDGKEIGSLVGAELQAYRRALQAVFQDHRQRGCATARSAGARHRRVKRSRIAARRRLALCP